MADSVFLMDGRAYNVEVESDSLERSFAVTDTDQSGRTMDYTMERDVIGTFYNYAMKVYPKDGDTASYDAFYDAVSDPNRDSHEMTFPYGQETLTFRAYVTQGNGQAPYPEREEPVGHGWPVIEFHGNGTAEEAIGNEMGYQGGEQWAAAICVSRGSCKYGAAAPTLCSVPSEVCKNGQQLS